MRPAQRLLSGGAKIPYPKHVWSPAGGWYAQPANWKTNTAVMSATIFGIVAIVWSISADREHRPNLPPDDRFFPSRLWARELREDRARKQAAAAAGSS